MAPTILSRIANELGLIAVSTSPKDIHILLATRCLRMFAYGSSTLNLAFFFSILGHDDTQIGLFMTLTLVGDVLISLVLTLVADSLGRRRILLLGAILMVFSGTVFATVSNYPILLLAAVLGVISPSGNEIGPFRAVEESTISHLTDARSRSDIFAFYVVAGTLGAAGGSLVAGWLAQAMQNHGWTQLASYRTIFWLYAFIGLVKAGMTLLLSNKCESEQSDPPRPPTTPQTRQREEDEDEPFIPSTSNNNSTTAPPNPLWRSWLTLPLSQASRRTLLKLSLLFSFDSLASGMVPNSLIAYYLTRKFPQSLSPSTLGTIIAAAQFLSSIGNIFASSVAKRIGLLRTMVFTHLPSAIFLTFLPVPTSLSWTILLLILRSLLASMDQAPRSAFLAVIVLPSERTATMGIVNTVKTTAQSGGPLITGVLARDKRFGIAFVIAGSLKASYDLAMLKMFTGVELEGESRQRGGSATTEEQQFELVAHEDLFDDDHEDYDEALNTSESRTDVHHL